MSEITFNIRHKYEPEFRQHLLLKNIQPASSKSSYQLTLMWFKAELASYLTEQTQVRTELMYTYTNRWLRVKLPLIFYQNKNQ